MDHPSATSDPRDTSRDTARRPRIALVIHALSGGGAERLMSQLANRWSRANYDVHLITLAGIDSTSPSDSHFTREYATESAVQRHGLGLMQPSRGPLDGIRANWIRVHRLRELLEQLSPDAILSFCDRMNITTATAAMPLDKPLWIAEHSDPARQRLGWFWERWRTWAYRRLARAANSGCVVLTESIAQTLHGRFPRLNLAIIPPAIDLYQCTNAMTQSSVASVKNTPVETASSGRNGEKVLLSIGRHSPEKNIDALLHAWKKVQQQFPDWKLVLAGDGPEHAELLSLAQRLQIGASVQFVGWVSDPWSLYRSCSLLAMASHYEGVPVAMLEAMAAGVPCVSTPCCSTVQEFSQAGGVQLATTDNASDIAEALSVAMADSSLRHGLAVRGRELVQQFSWESIGRRWDELLNKLV